MDLVLWRTQWNFYSFIFLGNKTISSLNSHHNNAESLKDTKNSNDGNLEKVRLTIFQFVY